MIPAQTLLQSFAPANWTTHYTDKAAAIHTRPWGTRIIKQLTHIFPPVRSWVNSVFHVDLAKTKEALTASITEVISQNPEELSDETQELIRKVAQNFKNLIGKNSAASLIGELNAEKIISDAQDAIQKRKAAQLPAPKITLNDAAVSTDSPSQAPANMDSAVSSAIIAATSATTAEANGIVITDPIFLVDTPVDMPVQEPASPGAESPQATSPLLAVPTSTPKRKMRTADKHDSDSDSTAGKTRTSTRRQKNPSSTHRK